MAKQVVSVGTSGATMAAVLANNFNELYIALTLGGSAGNVLKFGADNTGVLDSTAAIQAAIDFVKDGTVFIPAGVYLVSSLIVNKSTCIVGEGMGYASTGGSILKSVSAAPIITIGTATAATMNNFQIYGNLIADNGTQRQTGIVVDNMGSVLIDRVTVNNCGDYGIRLCKSVHSGGIKIINSSVSSCVKGGIYGKRLNPWQLNGVWITMNHIVGNHGDGINITGTTIIIRDNLIEGNDGSGVMLSGKELTAGTYGLNISIDNNHFEGNKGGDVYIEPYYNSTTGILNSFCSITIRRNYINTIPDLLNAGIIGAITIRLRTGSETAVNMVNDLVIEDNLVDLVAAAVYVDAAGLLNSSCTIKLNKSTSPNLKLINCTTAEVVLEGSYFSKPSQLTITAAGITGVNLHKLITFISPGGPIDITANPQIANGYEGQEISIVGSSDVNTLTLDNGAGLVLVGGASMILKLNSIIKLLFINGAWLEIYRKY